MMSPPMVGVPFLVSRWPSGPSSRIGWPLPCFLRSQRMNGAPMANAMIIAVNIAPPVRNVM